MTIAIVEDHKIVAESLKSFLTGRPGIREVRVFFDSESFLQSQKSWKPYIIISDLLMPGKNWAELIKAYRTDGREDLKIIILSSLTNKSMVHHIMKQGANGYIGKDEPIEELVKAINSVSKGERFLSEALKDKLLNTLFFEETIDYRLSPREQDVLRLICSGRIIKEIADELQLSVHTVQSYHNNVMRKFKVKRTPDLIIAAIQNGFYNPDVKQVN